jgi:ABC-type lipoprotein release transport system permease subunit
MSTMRRLPVALQFAARSLLRQPGRTVLGVVGIAATGALLLDMLMLSRGLVLSMEDLLESIGFDVRVMVTSASPRSGPRIGDATATTAAIAALAEVDQAVPMRLGEAEVSDVKLVDPDGDDEEIALIGATVTARRPWTLVRGRDLGPATATELPPLLVNENLADRLRRPLGAEVALRGACDDSSAPSAIFRLVGIVEFPFDEAAQLTAVTTLQDFARTCSDANDEADMVMVASAGDAGPDAAARAIRNIRPDLEVVTNDELVARFQQVEFSYFRQISVVLSSITLFFGMLLIAVLLSVSTNQRLGEIAALRALGLSRQRIITDVLWRSVLLVGTGGLAAIPVGLALATWLDALLKTMPGIPANVHFFVLEARALAVYSILLAATAAAAAIYPMRMVASLPIAATLREEIIS